MKLLRLFTALLFVLTVSCQKEQTYDVLNTQGLTISSRTMAMNGETASSAVWQNGDCMGVFFGDETSAVKFTYNDGSWSTDPTSVSAGSTIAAYTPWNDESNRNSVTILADQSSSDGIRNSDFLYAEGEKATIENNTLDLTFDHRLSQLIVKYTYTEDMAEDMADVSPANVKILNQPLTYSNSDGIWASGNELKSDITPLVNHGINGGTMEAILVPHTVASGTEFMTFTINDIPYTVTSKGWDFISTKNTTINLSIGPDNAQILDVKCSAEWQVTAATGFLTEVSGGYEIVDGTYYIYNANGLEAWRTAAETDNDLNAILMNHISLEYSDGQTSSNWKSIPNYSGTFDGNGKVISNIFINTGDNSRFGFIGTLGTSGKVIGLTLQSAILSISKTNTPVGGVVADNYGIVQDCAVQVELSGGNYAGGIVGRNYGTVSSCKLLSGSIVTSSLATGGIIGWSSNTSETTISNCHVYSMGDSRTIITAISGTSGGIIGEMKDAGSTIEACSVDADITVSSGSKALGGIIGIINNGSYAYKVNGCYYNGTLSSTTSKTLAGIVGNFSATFLNITSCYSMAGWNEENENNVQGILGAGNAANRTVTECYSTIRCGTNIGNKVDAITSEQATAMNGLLKNWKYVAAPDGNVFPFVIQPIN